MRDSTVVCCVCCCSRKYIGKHTPSHPIIFGGLVELLLLTSRIAMHRSLPYSSSMRYVSVDSTPSNSLILLCPTTTHGKTESGSSHGVLDRASGCFKPHIPINGGSG